MTVFDKTSREQAESVVVKLSERFKNSKFITGGIGVRENPKDSFVVMMYVNELSDKIRQAVPMSMDGVPIQLSEVGKVKPAKNP